MKLKIEKFIVLCRILICLLLILVWSLWIISLPNNQTQNLYALSSTYYTSLKEQEEIKKDKPQEIQQKNKSKKQVAKNKKKEIELPKLVDLKLENKNIEIKQEPEKQKANSQPVLEGQGSLSKTKQQPTAKSPKIDLPETAEATRKALTQTKTRQNLTQNKNSTNEVTLRNKITIPKKDITSSDASWLPRYIKEKQRLIKQFNELPDMHQKN